jgi:hypothetical protein
MEHFSAYSSPTFHLTHYYSIYYIIAREIVNISWFINFCIFIGGYDV